MKYEDSFGDRFNKYFSMSEKSPPTGKITHCRRMTYSKPLTDFLPQTPPQPVIASLPVIVSHPMTPSGPETASPSSIANQPMTPSPPISASHPVTPFGSETASPSSIANQRIIPSPPIIAYHPVIPSGPVNPRPKRIASQPMTPTPPMTASRPVTSCPKRTASQPMTPTPPITASRPVTVRQKRIVSQPMTPTPPITASRPVTVRRKRIVSQPMTPTPPITASRPMTPSRPVTARQKRIARQPMTPSPTITASHPMTPSRPVTPSRPMIVSISSKSCDSTNTYDVKPTLEAEDEFLYELNSILEEEVNELIKESWIAQSQGDLKLALEKAKEAGRKERELVKHWEHSGKESRIDLDLTFTVLFNLANQFENNELYQEAVNTYQVMVKNRHLNDTGQLRLNMANVYVKQKSYPTAIKIYCNALDRTHSCQKEIRNKLKQNIGVVFVHMRKYQDAIGYFREVMKESPNVTVGYNLVLCYYAIGDKKMMRDGFEMLILAPLTDGDKHCPSEVDTCQSTATVSKNDKLRQTKESPNKQAEIYIMTAAKLIAPAIETSVAAGLDWCMNIVKISENYVLASELEYAKAIAYLKQKDFRPAVEILSKLDLKDNRLKVATANKISLCHFLDKNYDQAEEFATLALMTEPHNPTALINKGNAVFHKQDYEMAVELYKEALNNVSTFPEALYNLGLCYTKLTQLEEALKCFLELHNILRNDNQVIYQLANLYDSLGDKHQAIEWLMHIISSTPTDPNVLAKLGQLHDDMGERLQAYQYYYESFKLFPCNVEVIQWLAVYHVKTQSLEKAVQLFERAAVLHPTQVRWKLYVAACYRRNGNLQKALEIYKHTHLMFPEDVECLCFLVNLCRDMGLEEAEKYTSKLEKLKRREQRLISAQLPSVRDQRENPEGNPAITYNISRVKQEKQRSKIRELINEPCELIPPEQPDASYVDPLGPQMERPRTGTNMCREVVNFNNEVLGPNFLP